MHFPWTRHIQRYEYILNKHYVEGMVVADFGCGVPQGSYALSSMATWVYAIDRDVRVGGVAVSNSAAHPERVTLIQDDFYNFTMGVNVGVAVEVFEHMEDTIRFVNFLGNLCEYVFITTPLASKTGVTRNHNHVMEYSKGDFERAVGKRFDIIDRKYQKSNLEIVDKARANGDSMDLGHVVQMLWCRRKSDG